MAAGFLLEDSYLISMAENYMYNRFFNMLFCFPTHMDLGLEYSCVVL